MAKKNLSYTLKKNIALSMAALTAFGTVAGTAVTAHAETTDEVVADGAPSNPVPAMEQALIKNAIGTIPVVGGVVSDVLDPLFAEILGVNPDNTGAILDKLNEIKDQISRLDLEMKKEIQEVLSQIYKEGLNDFNKDITSIRGIEVQLFELIATYKADNNLTELEKALKIGCLLDPSSTDTGEFVNKLNTCARYVSGQAVSLNPGEGGIFTRAFNAICQESKLVGEAAMKVAPYLNCVDSVIENGYKLESMVLNAKMVARQILAEMNKDERKAARDFIENRYSSGSKVRDLFCMCFNSATATDPDSDSTMRIWKKAAGIMENGHYTGAKGEYELICNANNPDSVVGQYNAMVTKEWFDFIESATIKDGKMEIVVQPLSKTLEGSDYKDLNIEQFNNRHSMLIIDAMQVKDAINNRFNNDSTNLPNPVYPKRTDVLSGNKAKQMLVSLKSVDQYKGKTDLEILKDYGFDVTTTLKKDSERYGVSAQDVNNMSDKDLVNATKPIIAYNASLEQGSERGVVAYKTNMEGRNLSTNDDETTKVLSVVWGQNNVLDPTYHKLLSFSCATDDPVKQTVDETNNTVNTDELDAQIEAGFQIVSSIDNEPTENPENKDNKDKTDKSIVLKVDENGQISGDKMNEAWSVAEDGTIILNKDNKFRFVGTVTDKKIQNNGEIVDGNFKNVKLELVDTAKITKGTFDDCDIITNENAVISDEVQLINSSVIDVKDMENKDADQKENQQDVVTDTPVSGN